MRAIHWYLNRFPIRSGKSRLFRLFEKHLTKNGPLLCRYDRDLVILADLNDWIQRQVYMYGVYRVEEIHRHFMLNQVRERTTVLDIGAHVGYYSLMFAKRVGAGGRVVAFEPAPRARERFMHNIALNDIRNIMLVDAAASDKEGEAIMYLADRSNIGSSSLHLCTQSGETHNVKTIVVDDYLREQGIDDVGLIKIDVEGHELHVLRGLTETLSRPAGQAPKLFVEINNATLSSSGTSMHEVFRELMDHGYVPYKIVAKDQCKTESQPFADSLVFFDKSEAAQ